jgi:hypothetical protein
MAVTELGEVATRRPEGRDEYFRSFWRDSSRATFESNRAIRSNIPGRKYRRFKQAATRIEAADMIDPPFPKREYEPARKNCN